MFVKLKHTLAGWRHEARLDALRDKGMHIGRDVHWPRNLYVDEEYCALISVGHSTSFGPDCALLAHRVGLEDSHGITVVGAITLHRSTHLGARTIVGPGVEVGPRTIVAAGSVVTRSLPPDTVCWGNPARPYSTIEQYLETHRERVRGGRRFDYMEYSIQFLDAAKRNELVTAAAEGDAYIMGGRSAELAGVGGSVRTPRGKYVPPRPYLWSEDPRLGNSPGP